MVPKTESFHIQNILTNGQLTTIPKTAARINDFWITYSKSKTVSQFYSDVSILDNQGNETNRKTISVNYPLISNSVYYYQTDWSLIGLRFKNLENETLEYPLLNFSKNLSIDLLDVLSFSFCEISQIIPLVTAHHFVDFIDFHACYL